MSLASRLMENKRGIASAGVVTIFSGALLGLALWYDGEATADVVLHDSGIWVTKTSSGELGRYNFEAGSIDGVMPTNSTGFDVEQDGGRVLLDNVANNEASPVNPAHLSVDGSLALPTGAQASSGGAASAVYDPDSGRLWVMPFDSARSFDEEELDPTAELGTDGEMVVGTDGTVWVATPGDGTLAKVTTSDNGTPGEPSTERVSLREDSDIQITAVGDQAVVLDRSTGTLNLPGGEQVQLDGLEEAELQIPSGPADTVAVATRESLINQPLGGGDALTQRASGRPGAPAQVGGCTYGAWSSTGEVLRDCPGTDSDDRQTLEGLTEQADLRYRINRDRIILNDVFGGGLWLPTENYLKVDDWELKDNQNEEGEKTESEDVIQEQVDWHIADRDQPNNPPQTEPDEIGVRPGRTTVLDVLGNDVDPDGDVMTASVSEGPPEGSGVVVDRVLDGAALQANVPEDATGTVTFKYQADDGRENGTATESVTLRIRPLDENEDPLPKDEDAKPVLTVAQAGTAEMNVLPYFKDPDGDTLFLSTATTQDPDDEVRKRPDGTLEFLDGGGTTGRKIVDVTVSDGQGGLAEGQVLIEVVADDVPPILVQDHVTTLAGEPVTVEPLENDRDPNGDKIRLTQVGHEPAGEITANHTAGTYRFVSEKPGSYDIPYHVSDGTEQVMGLVRIDVLEPPSEVGEPVAVSDQVLLPRGGEGLVDLLANDTDPAGRVLVVQDVDVPDDSGLTVAVLDHHVLKITENKRLETTATLEYTVSNGDKTATGQVSVVPIPASERLRPPEAGADEVDVHVGDTVTIPVLRNDSHPDGLPIELAEELVEEPEAELGQAFVSEETVRFKAGDTEGVAHAVYEVSDPNGQRDSAQIKINVLADEENNAPQLPDVTARVLSGGTVRIDVPLDGVDPDGDYVMLSDIADAPTKGRAKVVDGFIDFQASPDSVGTDTFTYNATDSRGAVGKGTIRVGIAPLPESNEKPVAQDDETLVRPERTVAIDALANDTDPDGDQIGLVESLFGSTGDLEPEVVEDKVIVTAPSKAGEHPFYYGIQDTYKARAQGTITVKVSEDAPLLPPVAHDDVLAVPDVLGQDSVTVDVLANDADPDGVPADLEVSLDSPTEGVTLGEDGKVNVTVRPELQVITYTVTDMDGLTSSAFIRVPADSQTPHLKPGLEPLEAVSGEPLEIDLNEYVIVEDGLKPRITEESTVSAVDGEAEVTGPDELVYVSKEDYSGPASVSFEVTDGDGPDDPDGRKATLTLPIEVRAPENQPPEVVGSPVLEVPAGEEGAVDLSAYVKDPEGDSLTFEMKSQGEGLGATIEGNTVTAQAEPSVAKGTSQSLAFTVTDGNTKPVPGELTVEVVASTRPLPATGEDVVKDAHQGVAESVSVLANDTNPFPETPLELVGAPVLETGTGTATYSGDQVVVTPGENFHGVMRVKYTVQDATRDEARQVDGMITMTVLGKPESPRAPRVEEVRSETAVLTWDEPNNNGAPITGYTVTSSKGDTHPCDSTTCTVKGLTNNVTYTFQVQAENEVGLSEKSPSSQEARPDQKPDQPAPPTLEFGDQSLKVTWKNRTYTDRSPIDCVNLEISPAPTDGAFQKKCQAGTATTWTGLENGTAYTVSVQAVNQAPSPSEWSDPSAPEVPAGPPFRPAAPTATRANTALGGEINVKWNAPDNNGDAIKKYQLQVLKGGSVVDTLNVTGTSQAVQNLDTKAEYSFKVRAENKAGKSEPSPASNAVQPYGTPDKPSAPKASLGSNTSGQANVSWSYGGDFRGTGTFFQVRSQPNTSTKDVSGQSTTFTGLSNGTSYRFIIRACNTNADGKTCSGWSAASGAVKPYTTPGTPTASWNKTKATDGYFTIGGPSSNGGNAVDQLRYSLNGGSWKSVGNGSHRVNVPTGYGKTHTIKVQAHNAAGWGSTKTASGKTDPQPKPRAWVTRGGNTSQCTNEPNDCWNWVLHYENFGSGTHRFACFAGDTRAHNGPSYWHDIKSHSKDFAGAATKYSGSGNSGTISTRCFMGASYNGTEVGVMSEEHGLFKSGTWPNPG